MNSFVFILSVFFCTFLYNYAGVLGEEGRWVPSVDECPTWEECEPSVREADNVDVKRDTDALHEALKMKSTKNLMNILFKRNLEQRLDLVQQYYLVYGEKLFDMISKNFVNKNFKQLVVSSLRPLPYLYADSLKTSIPGSASITEMPNKLIHSVSPVFNLNKPMSEIVSKVNSAFSGSYVETIEILGTLSNKGIQAIAENYHKRTGKTLSEALKIEKSNTEAEAKSVEPETEEAAVDDDSASKSSKSSKSNKNPKSTKTKQKVVDENLKKFLLRLVKGDKNENPEDDSYSVEEDIEKLKAAAKEKNSAIEMSDIVFSRNTEHLRRLNNQYKTSAKHELDESLSKSTNPTVAANVITLFKTRRDRAGFFAKKIYENLNIIHSLVMDNKMLIDTIIARSEIDLLTIKKAFDDLPGVDTLANIIKKKLQKDEFQEAILLLIGEPIATE